MQNRDMIRCKMHELPQTIWPFILADIPVCVYGLFGSGKSRIMNTTIFQMVKEKYGNDASLHDIRMGQLLREDLTGIPNLSESKDATVWTRPALIPQDDGKMHLMFMDEFGHNNSMDIQHACYGFVLDRLLGSFRLPKQNRIVLATNTTEDDGADMKMLRPLANRIAHIYAELDPVGFIAQTAEWGWDVRLRTFLKLRPKFTHVSFLRADMPPKSAGNPGQTWGPAEPSPRMWENVNKIIENVSEAEKIRDLSIGLVGERAANEFFEILRKIEAKLPPIDAILKDPENCRVPEDLDMQACIADQIEVHASARNAKEFAIYIYRLRPEVAAKCATNIVQRDSKLKESFKDLVA